MNDILYSSLIFTFCLTGYYYSWRYIAKDNYSIAVLLLVACGLFLRIYTASDLFLHEWDERYHALVAKNLIHHPLIPTLYNDPILPYDYKNWTSNHIWLHKQPLSLWAMAASMWMFGVNEIALRLPSIFLSTIGIWLTFVIGRYFFNNKIGYLAAFFFSINGFIVEITGGRVPSDHIDVFFLVLIELAIYCSILFAQKNKSVFNVLAGVCMGAAVLSKWLPALIVIPIWLLIMLETKKIKLKNILFPFIILILSALIIFLPWQLYIFSDFPLEATWEYSYNVKHFTQVIEGHTGPFYYFLDKMRINYGELIYLPFIWFLWKTTKKPFDKKNITISIWIIIPLLIFSMAKTKMQGYILFISPALFMITADFFFMLDEYRRNRKMKWLYTLVLCLLIALPIRYSIERIKPFNQMNRNPKWAIALRQLNENKTPKVVLFNYDRPIEAMFYAELTAYQIIPDSNTIAGLMESGYSIIINDNNKLPNNIKEMQGIRIERLP